MTCSPSDSVAPDLSLSGPAEALGRAERVLALHGADVLDIPGAAASPASWRAAVATALMDLFRRSADPEAFEALVQLSGPALLSRVRLRLRFLGAHFDPSEVLQDAIINIYRYPDRFEASRPGAFAAWSSTIVDNTIRRQLRKSRSGIDLTLRPAEMLEQHADGHAREPAMQAQDREECAQTLTAFHLLLQFYLNAFQGLSERERFVLQMVEVRQLRYAELATILGIRPEALKMVVFRARKRIHDRMVTTMLGLGVAPSALAVA